MSARGGISRPAARLRRRLIAALAALLFFTSARLHAANNLLNNGDFSLGSQGVSESVDGWRTDAWILTSGTTDYHWIRPHDGQPGEVELFTHHDNDARWAQQLSLAPGWYYISAELRTHAVLPTFTGANVSVLEDGIVSGDLKGDADWHRLGLYLKVGRHGGDVEVALRLGGYMNLTRGQAFFRDARVVKVPAPPAGAAHVYDLDEIRKGETKGPIGQPWTLVATFALFVLIAGVGWRMIGTPPVVVTRRTVVTRAERRRRERASGEAGTKRG